MTDAFTSACEEVLTKEKALLRKLKDEHFDLAITEVFDACPIGMNI